MTKVAASKDCGNSPKNQLLQDLTIAIARAETSRISDLVTADVQWLPVGKQPVEGRDAVIKAITRYGPATTLTIEHVMSHGRVGAANGVVTFDRKHRGFCFVFEFSSAKGAHV